MTSKMTGLSARVAGVTGPRPRRLRVGEGPGQGPARALLLCPRPAVTATGTPGVSSLAMLTGPRRDNGRAVRPGGQRGFVPLVLYNGHLHSGFPV